MRIGDLHIEHVRLMMIQRVFLLFSLPLQFLASPSISALYRY